MQKRILTSAGMIVFAAALVVGATGAFFSDTETSTGNIFTAGDIDLQIDNESYAIDYTIRGYENPIGRLALSTTTSWELTDLTIEKFFDFIDLKPGDYGEDTISIHVGSNDAWICAEATITADDDNSITEPEDEVAGANNDSNDGTTDGDLDSELNFAFWVDDGDNVLEEDETESIFINGTLADMGAQGQIALADSDEGILGPGIPIPGGETFYIAKAWCFGDLTPDPITQDGDGKTGQNGPLVRGTGISCDGADAGNIAQTDSVEGDITFYAEQARNNGQFQCRQPEEPVVTTLTLAKTVLPALLHPDSAYTLSAAGPTPISGIEGAGAVTSAPVTPGVYTLTETDGGFPGADVTWQCIGNATAEVDNGDGTATVTIAAGESVGCDVTNNYEQAGPTGPTT